MAEQPVAAAPSNGTSGGIFGNTPSKPFAGFGALNGGGTPMGSPAPQASPVKSNPFASLSKTPAGNPPGVGLFGSTSTTPAAPPKFTFGAQTPATPATPPTPAPPAAVAKKEEPAVKKNPFAAFAPVAPTPSTTPPTPAPSTTFQAQATPSSGLFGNVSSTASMGLFGSTAKIGENSASSSTFGKKAEEKPASTPSFGLFGSAPKPAAEPTKSEPAPTGDLFSRISGAPAPAPALAAPVALNSAATPSFSSGEISYPKLPPVPSSPSNNGFTPAPAPAPAPAPKFNSFTPPPQATTNGTSAFPLSSGSAASPSPDVDMGLNGLPPPPEEWHKPQKDLHDQLLMVKNLNVSFMEAMKEADLIADWRGMCEIYTQMYNTIMSGSLKRKDSSPPKEESPKRTKVENNVSSAAKLFGDIVDKSLSSSTGSSASSSLEKKPEQQEVKKTSEGDDFMKKPKFGFNPPTTTAPPPPSAAAQKLAEKPLFGFTPPGAPKPADAPAPQAEKPATPAPAPAPSMFSAPPPKTATPPKSSFFGSPNGGSVFAAQSTSSASTSGGLFSNLKPEVTSAKDKGEEDLENSPVKSSGVGIFGSSAPSGDKPAQPAFFFGAPKTAAPVATPEKPAAAPSNVFGSSAPSDKVDQTWKPGTPIKFGGSPSAAPAATEGSGNGGGPIFGNASAASSSSGGIFGSNVGTGFTFGKTSAPSASTSTTAAAAPTFGIFGAGGSGAQAPTSSFGSASSSFKFGGGGGSATSSDAESVASKSAAASAPAGSSSTTTTTDSNEPSDTVPTTKTDLSGPGPGEENDEVLYSVPAAVYTKDDATNKLKKIAVGTSRVLRDKSTGKTRLLVRTEQGKVAVNVWLVKELTYVVGGGGKAVLVPDLAGAGAGVKGMKVYTVRVRDAEMGKELARWCEEVKV
ncbi:hypothetical protein DFH27DRAFT_101043 [Peziza echinospora]|nr:hypothetical protein DFH27DRAFT_101043 [Peziza echinospora]